MGDGPIKRQLITLADQLGVSPSVEFASAKNIDDLRNEYLNASCLILPSRSEPWGLVVNEALSYGCPVIVSHRCGCVPELVLDGKTGYIFECGNIEQLAAKMIEAPRTFADNAQTAKQCTDLIAKYSPQAAAQRILEGCLATLDRSK